MITIIEIRIEIQLPIFNNRNNINQTKYKSKISDNFYEKLA